MSIQDTIKQQTAENPIILYMKGSAEMPLCGFSAKAVNLLKGCGVKFATINILDNPDLRQGIKDYSNWPTLPQLYVKGEFVGGCDIMMEMYESGELQELVKGVG